MAPADETSAASRPQRFPGLSVAIRRLARRPCDDRRAHIFKLHFEDDDDDSDTDIPEAEVTDAVPNEELNEQQAVELVASIDADFKANGRYGANWARSSPIGAAVLHVYQHHRAAVAAQGAWSTSLRRGAMPDSMVETLNGRLDAARIHLLAAKRKRDAEDKSERAPPAQPTPKEDTQNVAISTPPSSQQLQLAAPAINPPVVDLTETPDTEVEPLIPDWVVTEDVDSGECYYTHRLTGAVRYCPL